MKKKLSTVIIGFGNVGKRFAEICHGLGLKILIVSKYFDRIKNDYPEYISSDLNNWSDEEKEKFCLQQEVSTTKKTVLRLMSGDIYDETTSNSKPKTTLIPNLDELRKTHINSGALPPGVKITQEYNARRKRIVGLDMEASLHTRDVLSEVTSTGESN